MEKIKNEIGVDAQLQPSGGGVFEVSVDGKLVYSKKKTRQFPDEAKLVDQIKNG